MKALLLRPKFTGDFQEYTAPPLGLAYLAAVLEKNNHEVKILDGWVQDLDKELKILNNFDPDIIGLTGLTVDIKQTFLLADKIKELKPDSLIVFGGPHASLAPIQTLKEIKSIDIVMRGEGEKTIINLMEFLKKKKKLNEIKGITYREKNKIKSNPDETPIKDLDSLPFPARHLLPMQDYTPSPKEHKSLPGTDIITSRGCPYQCSFCYKQVFGSLYRTVSPKKVIGEIKFLKEKYKIKDLFFRDDTFTINEKRAIKICKLIRKEKLDITWTNLSRIDNLNKRLTQEMKKAGCWKVLLGIESGNQKSLDLLQKGITLKQIKEAVKNCKEAGIETDGFFMLGIPGETKEDAINTIDFSKNLGLDFAQFYITTPYPGTKLYEIAKNYGDISIKPNEWHKFNQYGDKNPVFIPNGWNGEELKKVQRKAWQSFYIRPDYLLSRLKKINSFSEFKNHVQGGLKLINLFR